MAEIKNFPNNADEYIGAENVMKWLHGRTSGVFGADNNLAVTAGNGLQVQVFDGVGWLSNYAGDGTVFWNDSKETSGANLVLGVDMSDPVYTRIDRVVVTWDTVDYAAKPRIEILKGTSSNTPTAPVLTNNTLKRQISLAKITIPAAISAITSAYITDERLDASVCGLVTGGVEVDTGVMQAQFSAFLADVKKELDALHAGTDVMTKSVYDTKGKQTDVFAEIDKKMSTAVYDPHSIGANAMVQPYTCTKSGTVYALTGSGVVGRCKIPAAFNAGDTFTVNGKTAKAYMGADAVDELAAGRWYFFVIDTEGDAVTVNFKSGRVKVSYTVNHNKQNVNGEGYTRYATQNLVGVKGKYVTPAVNSYIGFTAPDAQTVRLARGTIINYNYARNKYGWVAIHYTMNTDGSNYSYDSQTNGTAFYESSVTPGTKTITGFTSPSTKTIAINTENNEVKYYYPRNKYTVLCIDKCGESELGRGSWSAYYDTTAYGSSRGDNSSIDAYYSNYGYTGCSSANVGTSGATVYRYFELKRFSVTGANSSVYNPANNPGVWVTGGVSYSSQFSARVGTTVSFNLGVSIDNAITSEHGQEAVAMVWIYLNGSQVYEDSISVRGNFRQHYANGKRLSHTFNGAGTAQMLVQVKAKQENVSGASYGNCAAWVDSITCQHP